MLLIAIGNGSEKSQYSHERYLIQCQNSTRVTILLVKLEKEAGERSQGTFVQDQPRSSFQFDVVLLCHRKSYCVNQRIVVTKLNLSDNYI